MKRDDMSMGWYVVGYFDLLGQQDELRALKSLPDENDTEENERFIQSIKNTVGRVIRFEKAFRDYFEGFNSLNITEDPKLLDINPNLDKSHYKGNPVNLQQFSDCVIAYSSLSDETYKCPIQGVYAVLTAIASSIIGFMAQGIPIRGGIDVGLGTELSENNFYGPALARAYTLESKIAQHPRIVVGEELLRYLDLYLTYNGNDPVANYNKVVAGFSKELITRDNDGCAIIDFLGDAIMGMLEETRGKAIVTDAYRYAQNQFLQWHQKKDEKMIKRYTCLTDYFKSRGF